MYKVVAIKPNEVAATVEKLLNDMAANGWHMVGTQTNSYGATIAIIFCK